MRKQPFEELTPSDVMERNRQKSFDDLVGKLESVKRSFLIYTRHGLRDIEDKKWEEIESHLEELTQFIDELNSDMFKICSKP